MDLQPETALRLSHVKRFIELFQADSSFREGLARDPARIIAERQLQVEAEQMRPLWERGWSRETFGPGSLLFLYNAFARERLVSRHILQVAGSSTNAHYRAWRKRQMARGRAELGFDVNEILVHAPAALELSDGCSVGCWFCGVSAGRLQEYFAYTPENVRLWQGVLGVLRAQLGPAMAAGFCHWATDPLDNPEFERFGSDYHKRIGIFPQITTALPLRNPARTRALLRMATERDCPVNRFSILTLTQLHKVHQEFTPLELLHVELILQMPGANVVKAAAGRARQLRGEYPGKYAATPFNERGTIACVSGFLVNMVRRRVQLVSPCKPSDFWPMGYRVHTEGHFHDAADFQRLLEDMIAKYMPLEIPTEQVVRLRSGLHFETLEVGFRLTGVDRPWTIRGQPFLRALGQALHAGDQTAELLITRFAKEGLPNQKTLDLLQRLFDNGVLDDEPFIQPAADSRNLATLSAPGQ